MGRIISNLEKVSGAGAYAKQARQVQVMARKSAAESAKLKENMLKTLEQLKK